MTMSNHPAVFSCALKIGVSALIPAPVFKLRHVPLKHNVFVYRIAVAQIFPLRVRCKIKHEQNRTNKRTNGFCHQLQEQWKYIFGCSKIAKRTTCRPATNSRFEFLTVLVKMSAEHLRRHACTKSVKQRKFHESKSDT